jgi:hypothetical protein
LKVLVIDKERKMNRLSRIAYPFYAWPMAIGYLLLLFVVGYALILCAVAAAVWDSIRRRFRRSNTRPAIVYTGPVLVMDADGFVEPPEREEPVPPQVVPRFSAPNGSGAATGVTTGRKVVPISAASLSRRDGRDGERRAAGAPETVPNAARVVVPLRSTTNRRY